MQGGDISSYVSPRLVIVFEGLVATLPTTGARAREATARKLHRWKLAVDTYVINEICARHIWDVITRTDYSIDVVTYLGQEMVKPIQDWIDKENLPVGNVFATDPNMFARRLAHMPDVALVYDPDPAHRNTYGSKGRFINPENPQLMGNF